MQTLKEIDAIEQKYRDGLIDKNVHGLIYKITNTKNGKIYIGQSILELRTRFDRHMAYALGRHNLDTHLARAIRKYNRESFIIEPIDHAYSKDELTKKESWWIKHLNSIDGNIGYNETVAEFKCGGNTYLSKSSSEMEVIKKKIGESNSGSKNGNSSAVKMLNVNTGEELHFDTIKAAQEYFQEPQHITISRRCSHKILALYRKEWKVAYEGHDYDETEIISSSRYHVSRRRILFKNMETGEEKEFESYRAAEKFYNLPFKTIKTRRAKLPGESFKVLDKYLITVLK